MPLSAPKPPAPDRFVVSDSLILMGVIGKPHGVRGAVHVHGYGTDVQAIADLPLRDDHGRVVNLTWIGDGIARVSIEQDGQAVAIKDRDAAARLTNTKLMVPRASLPSTASEEFYLADLIGITAYLADGSKVGLVAAVHDYGAGASLELDSGMLIPFTRTAVPAVDLATSRIIIAPPVEIIGETALGETVSGASAR